MSFMGSMLAPRHIQNMSEAKSLQPHWGYADRAVPCTNDAGSCSYLDSVYHSHDLGMLYCGILWATIGGIVFIWGMGRRVLTTAQHQQSTIGRLQSTIASFSRQHFLPDSVRILFGRTTRLQVLILATLTAYLAIWTFVGITYKKWVTPVKNMPGVYNTRTGLGPWADRVGVLAYALTPLSVLLSSRESLLSLITGVPYQHFNFLHRWLGYIIFLQSALHTIGWCVVEMRLYQPQPTVGIEWIKQLYMIWGVIAMFLLTVIVVSSTPWAIRRTGYEFFRKSHYVLAMVYVGACWGHWSKLNCYLISSLVVWLIDRGVRLVRTALLHYNYLSQADMGFKSASAAITRFPDAVNGDVVRLDFAHPQDAWEIGEHFYLCFPELSIWQAHPFTPCSLPGRKPQGQTHSYVLRAKQGETKRLANLAAAKAAVSVQAGKAIVTSPPTTSVILTGPYGGSIVSQQSADTNVLCVAGGTGVTFVLPVLQFIVTQQNLRPDRRIELVWAIRRDDDLMWVKPELDLLQRAGAAHNLKIRIFVTRENARPHVESAMAQPTSKSYVVEDKMELMSDSSSSDEFKTSSNSGAGLLSIQHPSSLEQSPVSRHPDLRALVNGFVDSTVRGSTTVYASGPGGIVSDLRRVVAGCNSARKVWKGNERFDVQLVCDDRLEW
ncbi:hypothetical protein PV05_02155 [Exophiala xenobiotica]|uniref:FAD-binding FR-type domain-containing protein n=1 Tax=Exophiala xenobiotica TaxID=348802 RepID=A0A0D2DIG1_9EURO|nr:uncharacterized protein PV05_02155 [Exophiala xenobiotica]KIW62107.1 hypothetical protein PV05_02155 [Exophiala xenobiotica]